MPTDPAPPPPSLLDTLGVEITAVMTPVSICMLVVVLLVTALAPPPSSSSSAAAAPVTAANLVYAELPSDSPAHKLAGALLNAALFVALVTAATFLLLLLYYYNFTSCLRNYMRFSAFFVLASMGGSLLLQLLRNSHLPLDSLTVLTLLLNASVLGVLSVFSPAVPIIMRQSYTVLLGVITAAWFTRLPEWTTWTLLLALALYDLVAVLAPRGPLRMLVELASSREDDLPALVYEARPTGAPTPVPAHPLATFASPNSIELQPRRHSVVEIEEAEAETETETARLVPDGDDDEMEMFDSSRGIRLGLGDFVFYSVLVGRAAMYDLMTVYACYLAIIAGLGCTLILLAVCRKALPALPISITLGVVFYFLTRLLMEPFVVGAATSLVMF